MSIIYNGSISLTSSTLQDGIADPSNNQIYFVESTLPSFRKYDMSTFGFIGSATCLSSPGAICLINNASSVIASTSVTTVDFIENATNYRTNKAGGLALAGNAKNQRIAADTASGIAFYVSSTANKLVKLVGSPQSVTQITLPGVANFLPTCVILKSTGRWLVGGRFGKIYEINSSGNVVDELVVPLSPNTGILSTTALGNLAIDAISSMSYDNNMLLVGTEQALMLFDYSTKTLLKQMFIHQATNQPQNAVLCAAASGETVLSWSNAFGAGVENNLIQELDFTVAPFQLRDNLHTDSTNKIVSTGFNPTTALGFALQQTSEKIRIFSVVTRASTTRTFTVNPGGIDQKFRLILIDDSGGVGNASIILDTYAQSPATYRIPTGKTILELVKVGQGTNALWDYSRYTT